MGVRKYPHLRSQEYTPLLEEDQKKTFPTPSKPRMNGLVENSLIFSCKKSFVELYTEVNIHLHLHLSHVIIDQFEKNWGVL